ncbi:MAG: hypothetical protein J2P18_07540 [Nocardia sp.]|nr:hypothetical protein [Nocardia sp.]
MEKNYLGEYVAELDERGRRPVDTGVAAGMSVHGSFRVSYASYADQVVVEVAPHDSSAYAAMQMHLRPEQAAGLRDLLDAALSDYVAAHVVSVPAVEAGGR